MLFVAIALCVFVIFARRAAPGLYGRAADSPGVVLGLFAAVGVVSDRAFGATTDTAATADVAETMLSTLVFLSALQIEPARLARLSPASFRLAVIGAPIFLFAAAAAAFALLPGLSAWSAGALAAALVLNGAATDRRAFMRARAPEQMKSAVRLESAATLAFGAPFALIVAAAAMTPEAGPRPAAALEEAIASVLGGGLAGGLIAAAAGLPARRAAASGRARTASAWALGAGAVAFAAAAMTPLSAPAAAAGAGLVLARGARLSGESRRLLRRSGEQAVGPLAFALFGYVLGPRIVAEADLLVVLFAVFVVGGARILARESALATTDLDPASRRFVAWFGGAPGAASALFLLTLVDAGGLSDQETVLVSGATAVAAGVLITRLTSKPLARRYVKAAAAARRRFDPASA